MRQATATSARADWNPGLGAGPVVWERGRSVSRRTLLAAARQLADRLPEAGHVLNACTARSTFIVGFLAALARGHNTILATDRSERAIRQLRHLYPTLYCLSDGDSPGAELPTLSLTPPADGATGARAEPLSMALAGGQVAVTAFTSGSTGTPIAHPKSVATLAASARMIAQQLGLHGGRSTLVTTVPPQHMYGLEMSVLLPLWADVAVHSARPLYPADVAAALQEVPGPRHLVTTPVHLRALVESTVTLPEMESIVSASAPLPEAVAARAEKIFATKVIDLYGCTEAGTIATRRPTQDSRWTACGGIRLRATETGYIVTGTHLPEPVVVNDSIDLLTERTFHLRGRSDDQIKIAGRRTSLSALNAILTTIDGVKDGAFFVVEARHNPERQRLIAFVVAPGLSAAQVSAALRRNLDPALMPYQVRVVAQLPRSSTGKLPIATLAELAAQQPDSDEL